MKIFLQKQLLLKFQFKSLYLCFAVSVKGHFRRIRGHFGYIYIWNFYTLTISPYKLIYKISRFALSEKFPLLRTTLIIVCGNTSFVTIAAINICHSTSI